MAILHSSVAGGGVSVERRPPQHHRRRRLKDALSTQAGRAPHSYPAHGWCYNPSMATLDPSQHPGFP